MPRPETPLMPSEMAGAQPVAVPNATSLLQSPAFQQLVLSAQAIFTPLIQQLQLEPHNNGTVVESEEAQTPLGTTGSDAQPFQGCD